MQKQNLKYKIIYFFFLLIFLIPLFFLIKNGVSFSGHKEINTNKTLANGKQIGVTLNVLDKSYQVKPNEGSTVFDAMNKIAKENPKSFLFSYRKYPGMGVFISSINGIKGKKGGYWIYYINNKKASVGVSKYVLKPGDVIAWRQE